MPLRPESLAVSAGRPEAPGDPLNTPIVPASAFRAAPEVNGYGRDQVSPTVAAFETAAGALEGGTALAFASGLAGLSTLIGTLPVGATVVVPDEGYSGTVANFRAAGAAGRLDVRAVPVAELAASCEGAALVWAETVSNPLITVTDLPAVAAAAHAAGALFGVDATFSTPLVVRPLELGADVVMHSATKFLGGHSDVLLGVLVVRSGELRAQLHAARTLAGGIPGALEAFLGTRGIRTLAVRMERAQANALELAQRLDAHPAVTRVRYPGLPGDPGHAIATRDHDGFGAVLSLEVAGDAEAVCDRVRFITHATSLGGVESLIERRARYAVDASTGVPATLLRMSVGIEHVEDLWADLDQALAPAPPAAPR